MAYRNRTHAAHRLQTTLSSVQQYLPQMHDETKRRDLYVAIDRSTRWIFVTIKPDKTARSAHSFLKALHTQNLPHQDRQAADLLFASREREPSGNHQFGLLCQPFAPVSAQKQNPNIGYERGLRFSRSLVS